MSGQRIEWLWVGCMALLGLALGGCVGGNDSGGGNAVDTDAGTDPADTGPITFIESGTDDTGPGDGGPCTLEDGAPCVVLADAGPHCGDGLVNVDGEQCDDGNAIPGDGCSGICTQESQFWTCPPEGGPCVTTVVCGDGARVAVEACDDGNAVGGDGCSELCVVEPGYFCPTAGSPCERLQNCGDGRLQAGEVCDDGNTTSGDGCDINCREEPGYRCIRPGIPCEVVPICGDGVLAATEECDDGNPAGGDGCSADCIVEATFYDCSAVGQPCVYTVQCGDGDIEDQELCDDGNTNSNDGCSSDCQVEDGWACRRPGDACVPDCGDGHIMANVEECDDGNTTTGDGCSSTCRREPGYQCDGEPSTCTATDCGDGVVEGAEQCDEGTEDTDGDGLINGLFYGDGLGCTKTCAPEPSCEPANSDDPCVSNCGDGIKTGAEPCDDGNLVDGDGCSSTCTVEDGFTCDVVLQTDEEECDGGPCLILPVTFRDFKGQNESGGHKDFFYMGSTNGIDGRTVCVPNGSCGGTSGVDCADVEDDRTEMCLGLAEDQVDAEGKPVFNASRRDGNECDCRYTDWDDTGVLNSVATGNQEGHDVFEGMVPIVDSATSFGQWYRDGGPVVTTARDLLELESIGGGQYQFSSSDGRTVQDDIDDEVELESGLFPFEDAPASSKLCNLWPYWADWPSNCEGTQWSPAENERLDAEGVDRNFYFTSEARYLFFYRDSMNATLDFFGDDDVWVFINGHLALDLGGTHERLAGEVEISSDTASDYALQPGNIYEIVVFHADRHPRDSNYQLTLEGFETDLSDCYPTCGDAIRTTLEECDLGEAQNTGEYDGCNPDCTYGPFCGDGEPNGPEECDDGHNTTVGYNMSGCAPGCVFPPSCGDGDLQPGEECDLGDNQGGYDGCNVDCTLGPYCGDGVVQAEFEECDDGLNIGGYGQCAEGCVWGPRCGDGITQEDFGEVCDDGNTIDGDSCTNCGNDAICGDLIVQAELGETCDDGINDGSYGHCTIDCQVGPMCGDGFVQAADGEECDFGNDCSTGSCNVDAAYGGCTTQCRLGPHCGDGTLHEEYEQCDDGNNVAGDGCDPACMDEVQVE